MGVRNGAKDKSIGALIGFAVATLVAQGVSPDQLDPIIQLVETEMVGACLECHASGSML
jgi:hypothetical protein